MPTDIQATEHPFPLANVYLAARRPQAPLGLRSTISRKIQKNYGFREIARTAMYVPIPKHIAQGGIFDEDV